MTAPSIRETLKQMADQAPPPGADGQAAGPLPTFIPPELLDANRHPWCPAGHGLMRYKPPRKRRTDADEWDQPGDAAADAAAAAASNNKGFWGCRAWPACPISVDAGTGKIRWSKGYSQINVPRLNDRQAAAGYAAAMATLDSDQLAVASWRPRDGNVRVSAGAGSGKTRSAVALVASLLHEGVPPERLIVTTFTKRGGQEVEARLAQLVSVRQMAGMQLGTFHSIALRTMRAAEPWRWEPDRNIDLGPDARAGGVPSGWLLWQKILCWGDIPGLDRPSLGIEDRMNKLGVTGRDYASLAGLLRSQMISPGLYQRQLRDGGRTASRLPLFDMAWTLFKDAKAALKVYDFADVLESWWFHTRPKDGVYPHGGHIVVVDEAQDNSRRQLSLAENLAGGDGGAVVLIGDGRQSIFRWRGGYPELFETADVKLDAKTLELPNNYRSTQRIVLTANTVGAGLQEPAEVTPSRTVRLQAGSVRARCAGVDPNEEAVWVASDIARRIARGAIPSDFALLARTNAGVGLLEMALVAQRIPAQVSGTTFFDYPEIHAALCYCLLSQHDAPEALAVVLNKPKRYLPRTLTDEVKNAMAGGTNLLGALAQCRGKGRRALNVDGLIKDLAKLRAAGWPAAIWEINDLMELDKPTQHTEASDPSDDKEARALAFLAAAPDFDSPAQLYDFALACGAGGAGGAGSKPVQASTIHRFKGLEAKHVYVTASHGTFPHKRATSPKRQAEEERLFYVAATRAQDTVTYTWAMEQGDGKAAGPSRFLRDWILPLVEAWDAVDAKAAGREPAPPVEVSAEWLEKVKLRCAKLLAVARKSSHEGERDNAWLRVGEQIRQYTQLDATALGITKADEIAIARARRRG